MFDPADSQQIARLNKAVRASYTKLASFRDGRRKLIQEFTGPYYGDNNVEDQPVNMLALTVDIYLMLLAGSNPKVLLPTWNQQILPEIADLEAIVNRELGEMRFDKTLRKWVQEAIFCVGILKCGLVDAGYVELIPGEPLPSQDYFADVVDFDDFVFDTDASSWERITFLGDRYKVDYDAVMQSDEFSPLAKQGLKKHEVFDQEIERAAQISIDQGSEDQQEEKFIRTAYVWDVCLPEEKLVITVPDNPNVVTPLKVVEWTGTTNSPYHVLRFMDVPSNVMPLAPGALLRSLNSTLNGLYRKMIRQAKRQKTLGLYRHGNQDDAEKVMKADDGQLIGVENPETVTQVTYGGASQENLAFAMQIRQVFGEIAGNIDALGGLGPQADTARQDAMLASTVSKKAAKMSLVVVDATVEVVKSLIYHIVNDPVKSYQATRPIAGTSIEILAEMAPGERGFTLEDFSVEVQPYSMTYRSPQERAADLKGLFVELIFPMLPALMEQGINVKLQSLFELLAKYLDLPEIYQLFEFAAPLMPKGDAGETQQPQVSHRTYERVNRSGATSRGNAATMMQLAAGGNPQSSQVAKLNQQTGV